MRDDIGLTSYGANEAANYGHKRMIPVSVDDWKGQVDKEFFLGWERLRDIKLSSICKKVADDEGGD